MWGFYWGSETAEMWHGTGRPPLCLLHCIYNILWWWWWEGDACLMNHKVFQWGIEESSAPTDHIYHKDVTSNGVIACNITECFSSFISSNKSIHFSYYFFFLNACVSTHFLSKLADFIFKEEVVSFNERASMNSEWPTDSRKKLTGLKCSSVVKCKSALENNIIICDQQICLNSLRCVANMRER